MPSCLSGFSRAIAQRCASLSSEVDWASDSALQAVTGCVTGCVTV
jgi:hypothetical protein